MTAKKILFDITYLAYWRGKPTGIPRVIAELTRVYARQSNCVFVVWGTNEGRFYEVDPMSILSRGDDDKAFVFTPRFKGAQKLKPALLPAGIFLRGLTIMQDKHKIPVPKGMIKTVGALHKSRHKAVTMERGDLLFIPMGEWADKLYSDAVVSYVNHGVKLVQVCYDVLPLVTPQYSGHATKSMDEYNQKIFPLADRILVISEHTKTDLVRWLQAKKLRVPPVNVFRLGDDFHKIKPVQPSLPGGGSLREQKYIICVGTIEARKNHTLLYYTYKLASLRGIELPLLVIIGRRGWKTDNIVDIIKDDPDVNKRMVFLNNVSDEELSWLYENAMFSVYPSFYEGWGLPIAESISYGIPCVASNTSSMPEIAGDLITYFNPASTDECLKAITDMSSPDALQAARKLIKKYKPTSWSDTCRQVDEYIKEVYANEG